MESLKQIEIYFIIFLIYSIIGWLLEVTCKLIEKKKFINRGILIGPYCPIYGTGAILITLFLSKYRNDIIALFIMAIFLCGTLEYLTSLIMEKIFKARWWDYSHRKFNINGRICLGTMIPFGILAIIIVCVSNQIFLNILYKLSDITINIISIIGLIIFLTDTIVSFNVISQVRKTTTKINSDFKFDSTEEITEKVKDILLKKSILSRRLINAYPKINTIKEKIKIKKEEIHEKIANTTKKG